MTRIYESIPSRVEYKINNNIALITAIQSSVESNKGDIVGNASAIQTLSTSVTDDHGIMTANSTAITALQSTINDPENGISANASAIQSLSTTVTDDHGIMTANSTAITALQSTVNDPENGIAANASAIQTLSTTVTDDHGIMTANSTAITALQSTINDPENGISANASAIQTLQTGVTTNGETITAQASDITSLQTRVNDPDTGLSANALAIDSLNSIVTANEDSISVHQSKINSLQASVSSLPTVYVQPDEPTGGSYNVGDQWIDTDDNNQVYIWQGSSWEADASIQGVAVYARDNPPAAAGLNQGDLWFDTDDGNHQYRWDGTDWVDATDQRVTANVSAINHLETNVSGNGDAISANASNISAAKSTLSDIERDIDRLGPASVTWDQSGASPTLTPAEPLDYARVTWDQRSPDPAIAVKRYKVQMAMSNAVDNLQTTVTRQNGALSTHASNISKAQSDLADLQGIVGGNTNDIDAHAGAINSLQSDVSDNDGAISANASNISSAQSDINDLQGDVGDNTSDIGAHASAINSLTTEVNGKAEASALAALSATVDDNEGDIHTAQLLIGANQNNSWIDMHSNELNIVAGKGGSHEVGISTTGSNKPMFWAGGPRGSAPYRVKPDGSLYAASAHVKGKIEGTNGYLKNMKLKGGLTFETSGYITLPPNGNGTGTIDSSGYGLAMGQRVGWGAGTGDLGQLAYGAASAALSPASGLNVWSYNTLGLHGQNIQLHAGLFGNVDFNGAPLRDVGYVQEAVEGVKSITSSGVFTLNADHAVVPIDVSSNGVYIGKITGKAVKDGVTITLINIGTHSPGIRDSSSVIGGNIHIKGYSGSQNFYKGSSIRLACYNGDLYLNNDN